MAQTFLNLAQGVTGTLPTSNYVQGGITEADLFRLNGNENISTASFLTNWERDDTAFSKIGTGLTESGGVFSFPSTGIYMITAHCQYAADGNDATFAGIMIHVTTNNSSYSEDASSYGIMHNGLSGSTEHSAQMCSTIFDVTDTSNCKFKIQAEASHQCILKGNSSTNITYMTCIRLGDT